MKKVDRLQQLTSLTEKLGDEQKTLLKPLLVDVVYMESKLEKLRKLEHIRIHPKNPLRQEVTAAGRQYKETMQAYINAIKVISTALSRTETDGADELLSKLAEFEIR